MAVIDVAELTVKLDADTLPKSTSNAPVKFVPVIVMVALPAVLPLLALRPVTVGADATL
jgi:hypothetical protein